MLEVLHADYIKTAKAKGLKWPAIMLKHVVRNGILPVVTYVGPMTANIITGSVVIEQILTSVESVKYLLRVSRIGITQ